MIYLATPYTHDKAEVREHRYWQACALWQHFTIEGRRTVFSPIVHAHPSAVRFNMPTTHDFWQRWNRQMLLQSNILWVAQMDGWETSSGISYEMGIARDSHIPIEYIPVKTILTRYDLWHPDTDDVMF